MKTTTSNNNKRQQQTTSNNNKHKPKNASFFDSQPKCRSKPMVELFSLGPDSCARSSAFEQALGCSFVGAARSIHSMINPPGTLPITKLLLLFFRLPPTTLHRPTQLIHVTGLSLQLIQLKRQAQRTLMAPDLGRVASFGGVGSVFTGDPIKKSNDCRFLEINEELKMFLRLGVFLKGLL